MSKAPSPQFNAVELGAMLMTAFGAWSVFPEKPTILKEMFDPSKSNFAIPLQWFAIFALIWQGQGRRDVGNSLVATLVLYVIYHLLESPGVLSRFQSVKNTYMKPGVE